MNHDFWQTRWSAGQIGFHQLEASPALVRHWLAFLGWLGRGRGSGRVLVPLAGKSRDMTWLEEEGHSVVGVEFVEEAVAAYYAERGLVPTRTQVGGAVRFAAGAAVEMLVSDIFATSRGQLGAVDTVFDRAALVALPAEQRRAYVDKLAALLPVGGGLMSVVFEHDMGSGPPFSVPEVPALLTPDFEWERHDERDILNEEPRFRERGASQMLEVVYFARRKAS